MPTNRIPVFHMTCVCINRGDSKRIGMVPVVYV